MILINRQLLKLAKSSGGWILGIVAVKCVILIAIIAIFNTLSTLIETIGQATPNGQISTHIITAVAASAVGLLGNLLLGEMEFRCTARTRIRVRRSIYQKMLDLELGYLDKMGASKAITASIDGVEALERYYCKYLPALLYCLLAPIVLFFRIYGYSPTAAVILLGFSLLVVPANTAFRKIARLLKGEYWRSFENLGEFFLESLEGLTTLKLMNQDKRRHEQISDKSYGFHKVIVNTMRVTFYASLLTQAIIYGSILLSCFICVRDIIDGGLSLQAGSFVILIAFSFFEPVKALINTGHSALNGVAAAQNIYGLLDLDPAHGPTDENARAADAPIAGISFENVCFSYGGDKQVLHSVSAHIPKGATVALVGQSGCGKSTFVNLALRFYDPGAGGVYLDGKDLRSIPLEDLRQKISLVPQNTYIFSGTVEDNLKIAKPDATEREMLDVLSMVRLDSLIEGDGLQTSVGEAGDKLSGGQKQKIGIARALLTNADYFVFDEATSNVDAENENDIWECIHELGGEKTLLIISHRLSTVKGADTIYVMRGGAIADVGNHETLLQKQGLYFELITQQGKLENYGAEVVSSL